MKTPFFSSDVTESRIFPASFDSNTLTKVFIEAINYVIHIIDNHNIKVLMVKTVEYIPYTFNIIYFIVLIFLPTNFNNMS